MKARKAIKRLKRVEALLQTVIDQYDSATTEVSNLLGAASSSVASAAQALSSLVHTSPAKTDHAGTRKLSNATRKRLSVAAKKRWAVAKREGISTLAKSSRKTPAARAAAAAS